MTPDRFLAVDPGLAKTGGSGYAAFSRVGDVHRLVRAGVVRNHKTWGTLGSRIRGQRAALLTHAAYADGNVVSEWMTKRYGPLAKKVDVQDLIDLNALTGALGNFYVTPGEWKGGIPRPTEIQRSLLVLDAQELGIYEAAISKLPKGCHKEVSSAIGIGLSVAQRAHKKVGWPV